MHIHQVFFYIPSEEENKEEKHLGGSESYANQDPDMFKISAEQLRNLCEVPCI